MIGKTWIFTATFIALTTAPAFAECGAMQSSPSKQTASVKFVNSNAGMVNVLWYKFKGGTKKYRSLASSQSYTQSTFTNHVWAFTDAKGKCLSTYVVNGSGTYTIQ